MHPNDVAIDMVQLGADAISDVFPTMDRPGAVAAASAVLAATFPELAAIVAEQAHDRARNHAHREPVAAVADYAAELRTQAQEAAP
jgi:hypothetical protein